MSEKLSVSAIKNGTVIDHILAGQALRIIQLLSLHENENTITIGMRLPSKSMGSKDLIKIENRILTEREANEIVVFAPNATINVIQQFKVTNKITTHLPPLMKKVFICPNPACVSKVEPIDSSFKISTINRKIRLTCHYCEKEYDRDQVKVRI